MNFEIDTILSICGSPRVWEGAKRSDSSL